MLRKLFSFKPFNKEASVKYPAVINVPTEVQVSERQIADMIQTVLVQKFEIPIGDFDMNTYMLNGSWVIGCKDFDNFDHIADCGTKIHVVSFNEDAALLFDAAFILENGN